jgi:purine nucleosidase
MKRLDPEIGGFVEKITDFYMEFHWEWEHLIGCVINDPLAVAYFAQRDLCQGFAFYVQIETEGDLARGQSVVDSMNFYRHAPNAIVLTEVDTEGFFRLFLTKLLRLRETPDLLADLCRR